MDGSAGPSALVRSTSLTAAVGATLVSAVAACWWAVPRLGRVQAVWDSQYDPPAGEDHLDLAAHAVGLGVGAVAGFVFALFAVVAALWMATSPEPRPGMRFAVLCHVPAVIAAVVGSARTSVLLPVTVAGVVLVVAYVLTSHDVARAVSHARDRSHGARIGR